MRIVLWILIGLASTLASVVQGQGLVDVGCGLRSSESELREVLVHSLRWYSFWLNDEIRAGIPESGAVSASGVVLESKVVVAMCDVGLEVSVALDDTGGIGRLLFISRFSEKNCASNRAALESFVRFWYPPCGEHSEVPEIEARFTKPSDSLHQAEGADAALPLAFPRSPCLSDSARNQLCYFDSAIVAPRVDATYENEIATVEVSARTLERFREAVREAYPASAFRVVVPRFSEKDPMVYLAARTQSEEGLLVMRRDRSGEWYCERFIMKVPKNNIEGLLDKVESIAAAEFSIP